MKLFRTIVITAAVCSISMLIGCQESEKKQAKTEPAPTPKISQPVVEKTVKPEPKPEPKQEYIAKKDGQPKLVFEKPVHDLGKMVPDKYYNFEFAFTNKGSRELLIERTHAPCGCTVPKLDKKAYAPGESGVIKVRFHAPKRAGKVNKSIVVYSNDKTNVRIKLLIKGVVELAATVEPKTLKLSIKAENAGMQPIIIKSTTDKLISIASIKDVSGTMTFDFDPAAKATEFKLTATVDMEKLKKKPNGSITIIAHTPEANQLRVSYSAPPMFEVSRPKIIIQGAVAGKSQEKEVWITSNYDDNLEIESITSQKNHMKVIGQEKHDNRIKLTLKITPPVQEGKRRYFTDKVNVKIRNSEAISIHCSGWYAKK
jgi:hypothetical protein